MDTRSFIEIYKKDVELFQCSIISAVSTLIYSEYIRNIIDRPLPVRAIFVPKIYAVEEILHKDSPLMKMISDQLIKYIINHKLFSYIDKSSLVLFKDKYLNELTVILNKYIIPNISPAIARTIRMKFGIGDPDQQLIIESNGIDLFEREVISPSRLEYIFDETLIHILMNEKTVLKNIKPITSERFTIRDEIVGIRHENAISPIYVNSDIINNKSVIDLISFVTSTDFISDDSLYRINTSVNNEVTLILLN
jgi:hypothetical protein